MRRRPISTHAPAGGATTYNTTVYVDHVDDFYSRPCGRGDRDRAPEGKHVQHFYSRPCGRGDWGYSFKRPEYHQFLLTPLREGRQGVGVGYLGGIGISTHAPAGGATATAGTYPTSGFTFLLTPLREGRRFDSRKEARRYDDFYSRPCGRGDVPACVTPSASIKFLLTPLREGRRTLRPARFRFLPISTHAPAGGATSMDCAAAAGAAFLLTPLREGRPGELWVLTRKEAISTHAPAGGATRAPDHRIQRPDNFYSRPCGRGDKRVKQERYAARDFYSRPCGRGDASMSGLLQVTTKFLLTPLREGRRSGGSGGESAPPISTHAPAGGATAVALERRERADISTHAPAGGATAIFHKSVMRFCGKLPKDDTVLCLASFGFPRRDPKAVYLAWISCANLPQKCVRQGLALKDQGTSCFHEGLASHAFDPVLV